MNQKNQAERLAELSYLWTSGEWTLHRVHQSRARVVFLFPAGHPSPQELLAVRALVPRFANAPMSLLKAEVGNASEFIVGEFGGIEAHRLESQARARGLAVERHDASFTGYRPVSIRGAVLIIEDDELSTLATQEMLRRGVPIVSHEEID